MCRLALEITGAVLHMCLGFPFFTLKVPFCTMSFSCRFTSLGLQVPSCTWDYRCRFTHVFRVSVLYIRSAVLHLGLQVPFCTRVFRVAVLHITNAVLQLGLQVAFCTCV